MKLLLCCLAGALSCCAADWSSLYDSGKLEAERPRIQQAIDFVITNEITPFISHQEATFIGLQPIDLPSSGFRSNPLDFYSQGNHLVLPVRTMLFVEDLARSYGWLWANRYTTRTVDEYLSMLRYRAASSFADGKYPAPLSALHIPADALSDPRVVEASLRLRRTAYAFMILHQFRHVHLNQREGKNGGYSEEQEEDADKYALDIMKNNSTTPTGVLLVMQGLLFFEGGQDGAVHPITAHRLEAMAHFLDARVTEFVRGRPDRATASNGIFNIAVLLKQGAEWLSVRGHDEALQQLAMRTDPRTLLPRPLPKTTQ